MIVMTIVQGTTSRQPLELEVLPRVGEQLLAGPRIHEVLQVVHRPDRRPIILIDEGSKIGPLHTYFPETQL